MENDWNVVVVVVVEFKKKMWQGAKYLKRKKGAGASKTLRLVIGKTIEMW